MGENQHCVLDTHVRTTTSDVDSLRSAFHTDPAVASITLLHIENDVVARGTGGLLEVQAGRILP